MATEAGLVTSSKPRRTGGVSAGGLGPGSAVGVEKAPGVESVGVPLPDLRGPGAGTRAESGTS